MTTERRYYPYTYTQTWKRYDLFDSYVHCTLEVVYTQTHTHTLYQSSQNRVCIQNQHLRSIIKTTTRSHKPYTHTKDRQKERPTKKWMTKRGKKRRERREERERKKFHRYTHNRAQVVIVECSFRVCCVCCCSIKKEKKKKKIIYIFFGRREAENKYQSRKKIQILLSFLIQILVLSKFFYGFGEKKL